jgi:hypothetical protein
MITFFVLWCYLLIQGMAQIHRSSAFSKRQGVTKAAAARAFWRRGSAFWIRGECRARLGFGGGKSFGCVRSQRGIRSMTRDVGWWQLTAQIGSSYDPWEEYLCLLIGSRRLALDWSIKHGIVCSNDLILCKCVHLGMANKVVLGSINFLCTKNSFFIFLMLKMCYFVKHLPKISFKNGPPQI